MIKNNSSLQKKKLKLINQTLQQIFKLVITVIAVIKVKTVKTVHLELVTKFKFSVQKLTRLVQ